MLEERLLKILIREILKNDVRLRSKKGYNASHPVINRKPLMGYGDTYQFEEEPKKKKLSKKKVNVSRAFNDDDDLYDIEDNEDYEKVIKEILNGK
jgi:hypothetical protein